MALVKERDKLRLQQQQVWPSKSSIEFLLLHEGILRWAVVTGQVGDLQELDAGSMICNWCFADLLDALPPFSVPSAAITLQMERNRKIT
jgi:hypothetical protein